MNQEETLSKLSGELKVTQTVTIKPCFFNRNYVHVKIISHAGDRRFVYRRKEYTDGRALSEGTMHSYRHFALGHIKDYFERQKVATKKLQFEDTITLETR